MDEFIAQFLVESRELVEQATEDLLALEKFPDDAERFDNTFRAFHTLKGGAGIVDFAAMEDVLHRAENVLSAARANGARISETGIGDCLMCLDQVSRWLDTIQTTGAIPAEADAHAAAMAIVARFTRSAASTPLAAPASPDGQPTSWLAALRRAHPAAAATARTAVRHGPDADAFFRNEDPLALIASLPGLLAIEVAPATAWSTLDALDPFACNLVIDALLDASVDDVTSVLGQNRARCEIVPLDDASRTRDAHARELLEAQIALLDHSGERPHLGHIASAGAVAVNVLRSLGRTAAAERLATAAAASVNELAARKLREAIVAALEQAGPARTAPATASQDSKPQTLRVDAQRIDALVRLTGELTVAKNAIGHVVKLAAQTQSALAATLKNRHAALDRLIHELQRSVLAMRVLPLRVAFQRFPRLIREMSAELRKPVSLIVEGEDTEADKAIVEGLVEPLLHVLRNAMDHGVEDAARRSAAGKPAMATIWLRAYREGDQVLLEVTDDGAGIDVARIRQVARDRAISPDDVLTSMSDAEAIDLVFAPGFSTATTVTDLSGRGVGMDAVRTAVRRLGGQVAMDSMWGKGTTVRFALPFSVMLTQVMTVEAGGQMFGIPLDAVVETIAVPRSSIFPVGAARAIVLRERTLPLVELASILGATGTGSAGGSDDSGETARLIIAKIDGEFGALQVDKVGERMEVMLKPLDGLLADTPGIAGSTLLGDGSVLLVLDLAELLQ